MFDAENEKQAPFAIAETRETYYRDDGTSFTRSDIFVKLAVNFRDSMLKRMKGPMLSVFLCIALHCDESRKSWPSLATIEKETGYTHPAVLRALSELESLGVIERRQRHNQDDGLASNEYSIKGFATMGVGNDVTRGLVTTLPRVGNDVTTKKKPYKKNQLEEVEEQPQKPKPPRKQKAQIPPAIEAFRKASRKYPNRAIWGTIESAVAADAASLERWESVVRAYIGMGWNPANVAGMLDYYNRGEIPAPRGPNGAPAPKRAPVETVQPGDYIDPAEFFGGHNVKRGNGS